MKRILPIVALAALAAGSAMCAEVKEGRPAPRTPSMAAKPTGKPNLDLNFPRKAAKPGASPLIRTTPDPANTLERWNKMTPEQRARAMSKLTPERRQQIQQRLDSLNALPRDEQERLRRRYDRFTHLTPERQALVRRQIAAFTRLPDGRRASISKEFDELRRLSGDDRRARMNSEEFRNRYSPREQQLLGDLSENLTLPPAR